MLLSITVIVDTCRSRMPAAVSGVSLMPTYARCRIVINWQLHMEKPRWVVSSPPAKTGCGQRPGTWACDGSRTWPDIQPNDAILSREPYEHAGPDLGSSLAGGFNNRLAAPGDRSRSALGLRSRDPAIWLGCWTSLSLMVRHRQVARSCEEPSNRGRYILRCHPRDRKCSCIGPNGYPHASPSLRPGTLLVPHSDSGKNVQDCLVRSPGRDVP